MLTAEDVRALVEQVGRLERRVAQLEADALEDQLRRTLSVCLQGLSDEHDHDHDDGLAVRRRRPGRRVRTRRRQ